MGDPRTWSTFAAVPITGDSGEPELTELQRTREAKDATVGGDTTGHNIKNRVIATWKWAGVDAATGKWHSYAYKPGLAAWATAADSGAFLRVNDTAATSGDTSISLDNLAAGAGVPINRGWHFQFIGKGKGEIFTIAATTTVDTNAEATVNIYPALNENIDDDTPVGFFRAVDVRVEASGGGMYDIVVQEETVSDIGGVGQAQDSDVWEDV